MAALAASPPLRAEGGPSLAPGRRARLGGCPRAPTSLSGGTPSCCSGWGSGWNLSFVAATAELDDRTEPAERGKLLGFNDLLSGMTGAGLALLGGVALSALGVAALAIGGTALVVGPALWILREEGPRALAPRRS